MGFCHSDIWSYVRYRAYLPNDKRTYRGKSVSVLPYFEAKGLDTPYLGYYVRVCHSPVCPFYAHIRAYVCHDHVRFVSFAPVYSGKRDILGQM